MKFDLLGLPQENGASDLQDSARLAGIMTVFNYPNFLPLSPYIQIWPFQYMRHPLERKYDFSRDQAICFFAGLWANSAFTLVDMDGVTGSDIWSPAAKGHIERCKGGKASWFQDLWFWAEIYYHAKYTPLEEPNQILCMMMVADTKFLRKWVALNPVWEKSVTDYWCGSRGEPELAHLIIETIKRRLENHSSEPK